MQTRSASGWRAMARSHNTIAFAIEACRRELLGISPTPALDARVLAGSALGMDASALIAYGENEIDERRFAQLAAMTARRKAGEPVAYIIGSKEFYGKRFIVDRRVLIPRPETEELVARIVSDWRGKAPSVLDLGTGSGAIACSVADALPSARVLATDASSDALEVAAQNVAAFVLGEQVELAHGNLFSAVPPGRRFDVIAANLPYVGEADRDILEDGVRDHEPSASLFAGGDGLNTYRAMLEAAPQYLEAGGRLYMECGPRNAYPLAGLAASAFPGRRVEVVLDRGGRERMVIVV